MMVPRSMAAVGIQLRPAACVAQSGKAAFMGRSARPAGGTNNSNDIGCSIMAALATVGALCALLGWGVRYFR